MVQCRSCGGTYEPVQSNGMQYFHACPPLSSVELAAAVDAGAIALPTDPVTKAAETPAVAVTRRVYERANKRDENVTGPATKAGADAPIKAAGDGVDLLVTETPAPVVVVPMPPVKV